MSTFTPPLYTSNPVPPFAADTRGVALRLARHMQNGPRGRNVFILTNGTVTETEPDGTSVTWDQVAHAFWGGHQGETVTAAEATLLTNAGYTVT